MYCMLAMAAQHRLTVQNCVVEDLTLTKMQCSTYYSAAIKQLQLRLDDSMLSITDETIMAILILACDVSVVDLEDNLLLTIGAVQICSCCEKLSTSHGNCHYVDRIARWS